MGIKGRAAILEIHLKGKKLAKDLTIEDCAKKLAARTPGMSGADLANVTNEGALMAARQGKKKIDFSDFNKAIDRVIAGIEKKSNVSTVRYATHARGANFGSDLCLAWWPRRREAVL